MKQTLKALSVVAATTMLAIPAQSAFAESNVQIGVLDCNLANSTGEVLGSKRALECTFTHKDGQVENYTGEIGDIGIDLGKSKNANMKWGVFQMKDSALQSHPLAGTYLGVSAGATIGKGMDANALIGGNSGSIGLQPISLETQDGLNINVGFSGMKLIPVGN